MKILIFDTETTGLIPKGCNYKEHFMEFPYLVQIAWEYEGELKDFIIKPDGWVIPQESTEIHGISQEKAESEGQPLEIVLDLFLQDCFFAEKIVGHNMFFDTSIIKANLLRAGDQELYEISEEVLDKSKRIDTMWKSIKLCALKQKGSNRPKFPTLEDLYWKLFEEEFPAHDAREDVIATKRCFDELVKIDIL